MFKNDFDTSKISYRVCPLKPFFSSVLFFGGVGVDTFFSFSDFSLIYDKKSVKGANICLAPYLSYLIPSGILKCVQVINGRSPHP